MKTRTWMPAALLALLTGTATLEAGPRGAADEIRATLRDFAEASDKQDASRVEKHLHNRFTVYAEIAGQDGVLVLGKDDYVGKFRSKEFGGEVRKIIIDSVEVRGNLALASVRYEGKNSRFDARYSLVRGKNGWQLVADVVRLSFVK